MGDNQGVKQENSQKAVKTFTIRQLIKPSGCFTICLIQTIALTWSAKLISDELSSSIWMYGGIVTFLAMPLAYLIDRMLTNQENKMKGTDGK